MIGAIAEAGGTRDETQSLAARRNSLRRGSEPDSRRGENGWFGLLPKHIDFVTALVPGVMTFQPCGKPEEYLARRRGVLVKCGAEVAVSTRQAVRGTSLAQLKQEVERQFLARQEREKAARALSKPNWRPTSCGICWRRRNMADPEEPDKCRRGRTHDSRSRREAEPHRAGARRRQTASGVPSKCWAWWAGR